MYKILGVILILLPFIALAIILRVEIGATFTLYVFGSSVLVLLCLYSGLWLLTKGEQ